jgi:hypothetical protein
MLTVVSGLAFSALYVLRGFGVTAWTHALYDAGFAVVLSRSRVFRVEWAAEKADRSDDAVNKEEDSVACQFSFFCGPLLQGCPAVP